MEFIDVINARISVREFSSKPVEDEKITHALECARRAPSWMNKQCWRFIVIRKKEVIQEIAHTSVINRWLKNAPVIIVACADPTESGKQGEKAYYMVDTAIAFDHLVLAATDAGLGTCWVAGFNEEKVKHVLEIPRRIRIVALTPLGYPMERKGVVAQITKTLLKPQKRKSLDEIVHYEHW
jgi:nitroreductase